MLKQLSCQATNYSASYLHLFNFLTFEEFDFTNLTATCAFTHIHPYNIQVG